MNALDLYQGQARMTAIYPADMEILYPTLGLVGEAGEVAEKIKKWKRDGTFDRGAIAKELGDVLWYLANLSSDLGYKLSEIAEINIHKLEQRVAKGTLQGSGDNR